MSSIVQRALGVIAVPALIVAQLCGVAAGYVCDCPGGSVQPIASATCDADHCHPGEPHRELPAPVPHESDSPDDHPHRESRGDFSATSLVGGTIKAPAALANDCDPAWMLPSLADAAADAAAPGAGTGLAVRLRPPPSPPPVTSTIVLRI